MGIATLARHASAVMIMAGALTPVLAAASEPLNGHFLDLPALLENRSDTGTSALLADIKAPRLEEQPDSGDYRVKSAMLVNTRDKPDGFIVVVARRDGAFTALVNTTARSGLVVGKADGTQTFLEEENTDRQDDYVEEPQQQADNQSGPNEPPANEQVTLTVLAGFSDASAQRVGDPEGFALAQIETLNMALRNTGLPHIQATLAGVSTTPIDYEISGANLGLVQSLFPNHAKADLVASFVGTWNGINGIAYRNGRISMTHVATTSTFAHEIGHNIGGVHCPEGNGYNYGYFTGEYSSLLCRKGSWFLSFSNPAKLAPDGVPLGDPATADMARVWRENAPKKSSGLGNDSQRPILLHSMAASNECLDVLDGNMSSGARVGLWKCDPNNPNQRWYKIYLNDSVQFRLAAKPSLCLYHNPAGGKDRDVILNEGGCPHITWTPEDKAFRTWGNGEYLYLHRAADNRLRATVGMPNAANPGYYWESRSAQ